MNLRLRCGDDNSDGDVVEMVEHCREVHGTWGFGCYGERFV